MKTGRYLLGMGLAAALMVPQTAFAAGFANTSHSATATGMAGVAAGNPDEPNASYYNPASMVFRDSLNVYLGNTTILPSVSYVSPDGEISEQTESQVFPPPNFHLGVPITEEFSAGIGAAYTWGLGIAWPDEWVGREVFRSQSLETFNINPAVAYKVPGLDLGVAAGMQVMLSSMRQERAIILRDDREVDVVLGGQGWGIGATAAAMFRPTSDITVGLNYRSGATLSYDGHIHYSDDVEGTPFEQRMIDQEIAADLNIPHTLNLGLGWRPIDELWLGLDVNYMTWSSYDQVEVEFSQQSPQGEPGETDPPLLIEADWEDAVAIRLGGQYDITDALMGRLGFAIDMTPVPDETVNPSLPDNNRYVFAAGVGYKLMGFRADLGYNFIYLQEREIANGNVDGTYQLGSHLVGVNVGYGVSPVER